MRRFLLLLCLAALACGQEPRLSLADFRDVPLSWALRILSEQTGLNLVASEAALAKRVTLNLRETSALDAVDALCQTHGLWYTRDGSGIIRIHTVEEYRRDLNEFRVENTEVFTLLYPNALDVGYAIRDLWGNRVLLATGEDREDDYDELQERFERFDLFDGRGQGFGTDQQGTSNTSNRRFDNNRRNNRNNVRNDLLTRIDRDDRLADIEARRLQGLSTSEILALERAEAEEAERQRILDAQLATIFVSVIQRNNQVVVRTADERTMQEIRSLIRRLDVPTPLVLLEVKVLSVDLGDEFNSVFDWQLSDAVNNAGGFTSGDILPPGSDAIDGSVARRMSSLGLGGTGLVDGALTYQFVHSKFRARVQLLEDQNRVTSLATPLLLTANNEVSRLFVGEEVPLNRSFGGSSTIAADGTVIIDPGTTDIEFRPIGTTLLITPNINADRTVTLRLLQETSSISPTPANVLVPSANGFEQQQVDVVQTRSVSGTIVAKHGLAVAVGGLIEETLFDSDSQVPILGSIPIFGFFFRRENKGTTRKELIVVVRPFVLNTPAEAEQISKELLEELSLHPNAPDAEGTLRSFDGDEVLVPNDTRNLIEHLHFHSVGEE